MNCKIAFLKTFSLILIGLIGTTLISCSDGSSSIESQADADESIEVDEITELIKPIGQFVVSGSMGNDRQSHYMVLLNDGRILTTGGRGKGVGGHRALVHPTAEIYDPATNKWEYTGEQSEGRTKNLVAVLPDGSVLAAGGERETTEGIRSAERWDPSNGTWSQTGDMIKARERSAWAQLLDGRVIVIGGFDTKKAKRLTTVEAYDQETGEWSELAPMATERTLHTATTLKDGRVLVVGGGKLDGPHIDLAEIYDPKSNTWADAGNMLLGRVLHTATLLSDGRVLVVGGQGKIVGGTGKVTSAEIWDPESLSWSSAGNTEIPRSEHAANVLIDGRVLVTGGQGAKNTAEIYNPEDSSWIKTSDMIKSRYRHAVITLPDGRVLISGGVAEDEVFAESELFIP